MPKFSMLQANFLSFFIEHIFEHIFFPKLSSLQAFMQHKNVHAGSTKAVIVKKLAQPNKGTSDAVKVKNNTI